MRDIFWGWIDGDTILSYPARVLKWSRGKISTFHNRVHAIRVQIPNLDSAVLSALWGYPVLKTIDKTCGIQFLDHWSNFDRVISETHYFQWSQIHLFCNLPTSTPPTDRSKCDHHQNDPKISPEIPSSWSVWILRSPRGQKVDLIATILFFRQIGPKQGGCLGTNPLYPHAYASV